MDSLRLVFAGSPAAAVPSLNRLTESAHAVVAVVTRADSSQGRRGILTPTPVAVAAEQRGLPIIRTNRLAGEPTEQLVRMQADLGVIVAYGALIREPLLSAPRLGWINLHFSLLPRWRGAAPVQHAIIAGDEVTGATVFQLVADLDAGAVLGSMTQPIGTEQNAASLLHALAQSGSLLLEQVVDALADRTVQAVPQAGEATWAPKLDPAIGRIPWTEQARTVHDLIRGVTPEPGAFTDIGGQRLKVLSATVARDSAWLSPGLIEGNSRSVFVGTATEPIELLVVQPAGRRSMDAASWWRGVAHHGPVVAS